MRLPLLLAAMISWASAATAAPAIEDRYGPARHDAAHILASHQADGPYQGRLLTWSSRAFTPQVPESSAVAAPIAAVAAPPERVRPSPTATVAPPRQARAVAPPDSLYAPPPPQAAPQRLAQAPMAAAAGEQGSHVRLYSVHRQYGLAPDAIPPATTGSGYVLIGPREGSGAGSDRETTSDDDADRPF